ncbi:unnamed protein product, partial [Allacma fusca]
MSTKFLSQRQKRRKVSQAVRQDLQEIFLDPFQESNKPGSSGNGKCRVEIGSFIHELNIKSANQNVPSQDWCVESEDSESNSSFVSPSGLHFEVSSAEFSSEDLFSEHEDEPCHNNIAPTLEENLKQLIPKRSKYLLTSSIEKLDEEESVRPVRKRGKIIKQSDVEYEFRSLDCDPGNNENSSGTSDISFLPIPKTLLLHVKDSSQLPETSAEIPDNVKFAGKSSAIEPAKRFDERVLTQLQRISLGIAELSADVKVLKQRSNLSKTRFEVIGLPQLPLKTPKEVMEFSDLVRQPEVTLANI